MKKSERQPTRTLPPLNLGLVFKAYNVHGKIAILDEETKNVWFGYDLKPTKIDNITSYPEVKLLPIPDYGKEKHAIIGGVGKTLRRVGLLKGNPDYRNIYGSSFANIFVTNILNKDEFSEKLDSLPEYCVTVEELEDGEDEYGLVAKLLCEIEQLHVICANIARLGAKIFISDKKINSFEFLGIERLDRRDEQPKRAPQNWNYSFLPESWHGVPTLWHNLAGNMCGVDIELIPQPLKQYVAAYLINEKNFTEYIKYLENYKWVSASLEYEQSKQLINANYILNVEQHCDLVQVELSQMILWRYLIMRGYSSRWLGKYDQNAKFLGNGHVIRKFKDLVQYNIENLSTDILERVYKKDGSLQGKGNKGSRSKYVDEDRRYVPKRRMKRYHNMEELMKQKPYKSQKADEYECEENKKKCEDEYYENDDGYDDDEDEWEDVCVY